MLDLRKVVAPDFIFGPGAINLVGRYLANFGAKKVLVVTDQGVIDAVWAGRLTDLLSRDGLDFAILSRISANPRDSQVMAGADFYHQEKCDIIVAVGGGSPMDCAKGIGSVSTNHSYILDYEGIDKVDIPGPPLICIPT
ncbi:MAG TPA: iron-containing alcohol dehydrogenase, partial [Desulforhopalus sp.]|nr:iron-containing alcohol dehydrogenase [Desulforhopalus sp.]